ncbi:NADPH-dependent FMN reductase [Pseudarthrobacter sp. J1738]|uniref:NADPH-dependent FMN reductase n=1 Tax=unclassified Pseudarthrobacter TaxID=2647000 RepID=UPI003D2A0934
MKLVVLSGANVGTRTRTVMNRVLEAVREFDPTIDASLIDLSELIMPFADGRIYTEQTGDAGWLTAQIMEADALIIGSPVFQASIPAALKNVFDLLPVNAFRGKVAGMVVTAGSAKHYLVGQQQLQPILTYMKAQVVQPYVFVEQVDVHRGEIVNHDVDQRLERLAQDTVALSRAFTHVLQEAEAAYGF